MIELVKSSVVFSEENHTYFLGEKQLKGITGMISRQLFPNKYKDIPEYILKKAAEKGSRIHGQCQFADVTGLPPESIEAINYIRERVNAGYKAFANEYTVSDNEYFASNIDCVWEKDEKISLGDIKTTASLDREYLSWQLSIYAYLFELQNPLIKVDKLFGIWLRGDKSELVEIERKPDAEVKRLLECEIKGEQFLPNAPVPADEKQLIPMQLVNTIIDIEEQAKCRKVIRNSLKVPCVRTVLNHGTPVGCVLAILPLQRVRVLMQRSFRKITRNYILNI